MCFFAAVEAGGSRNLPERGELLPPLMDFLVILTQFVRLSSRERIKPTVWMRGQGFEPRNSYENGS